VKYGGAREILGTYIFFGMRLALPLIALPLFSHILSPGDMGDLLAAQSLGLLGSIFIQYGFHQSAPRELSLTSDLAEHRLIASRVVQCQLVNCATAAIIIGILFAHGSHSSAVVALTMSAIITAIGTGMSSAWFFRGIGRATLGMAFDFAGQAIGLILIALPVYLKFGVGSIAVAYAVGPLISAIIGLMLVVQKTGGLVRIPLRESLSRLRTGTDLFFVRGSSAVLTTGSIWLVSIMASSAQAAYFGIASKLVGAATSLTQPVLFSIMPRVASRASSAPREAVAIAIRFGAMLLLLGLCSAILLQIFAPLVISLLFSQDMAPARYFVVALAWICIPMALRDTIGELVLIPFHADKYVARSVVIAMLTGTLTAVIAIPQIGGWGMIVARYSAEAVAIILLTWWGRNVIRRRQG